MFSQMCERRSGRVSERPLRKLSAVLAVSLLAPAGSILAGPSGELDASFGVNGRLRLDNPDPDRLTIGRAIAEQPADGKLLLAGEDYWEGAFLVYRLNADGSPDSSFGDGGSVVIDFHPDNPFTASPWGEATAIAVQPDGRIVVGGRADSSYGVPPYGNVLLLEDVGLVRLNPDGSIDPSFGENGRVILDLGGGREYLSDLVLLPGGEIVIAGSTDAHGDFDTVFARLTPNGALDTTFGSGPAGITIIPSRGYDERPQALVRQTDGSLIACGESSRTGTGTAGTVMSAARVFANGSIDVGFGFRGQALVDASAAASSARDCILLPDGTLLLAGFSGTAGAEDFQLAWLGSDGQRAVQYGQGGLRTLNLGASESIQGMTSMADGSVAVTGLTGTVVNQVYLDGWAVSPFPSTRPSAMLFAKLDPFSGQLDPAFGDNGVTHVDFGRNNAASLAYGRAIVQTRDGKLAAVGTAIDIPSPAISVNGEAYPAFAVAQIDPAGPGNPGFVGFVKTESYIAGASTVVAEVRRTGGSSGPVSVDYRTASDTLSAPGDYTAVSGTLFWNDAETTVKQINIPVHRQDAFTGSISVVLENATGPIAASEFTIWRRQPSLAPTITNDGSGAGASGAYESGGGGAFGFDVLILLGLLARSRRSGRLMCRVA